MDLIGALRRMRTRVDSMVARAVISRVNDAMKTQRLQLTILADEVEDDVEHVQPYGLSFTPPNGAEVIALAVGGARSHTVAICAHVPGERPTASPAGTGGLYTNGEWRVFVDAAGVVMLGGNDATEPIPLGTALNTWLSTHTHPTAMGPSGPPAETAALPDHLSAVSKVK